MFYKNNLKIIIVKKKLMNIGNFWSKDEELKLMDEISEKIPIENIAKSHGRTVKAIEMRLESMIRKQYNGSATISSLMSLYNKTEAEIKKIIQDQPKQQTKEKKKDRNIDEKLNKIEEKINNLEKIILKIYKKIK